jgi:hypothetical protein
VFNSTGSVLMAILLHAVLNAAGRLWNTLPEYSVEPPTAAEAAAQTVHINIMMTIVLWVAAVVWWCSSTGRATSRAIPGRCRQLSAASPNQGCNNQRLWNSRLPCVQAYDNDF